MVGPPAIASESRSRVAETLGQTRKTDRASGT
jgi:hypothetical protein